MTGDDAERFCENLREILPDSPNQPYDMKKGHRLGRGRRRLHGGPRHLRPAGDVWVRALDGHTIGIVSNQPQDSRGCAGHRLLGEGRTIRAHVRRLQYSARYLR